MASALDNITIIDLTSYLAGPFGCALLGDLGARVIKVEAPGGDAFRLYPTSLEGENRTFLGANRNKRSIIIDLKKKEGLAALYRLIEQADVVIHNFRPSVPEALGIDYETVKRLRPDLIYCALTGYGQTGPLSGHPGFDQMLQCFSGIADAQGTGTGRPQILLGSTVDFYTSTLVAYGILGALVHRMRTGEGQQVDVSLLRSSLTLQVGRMIWAEKEPRDVPRELPAGRITDAHPTKEGFLYVQASTPPFWKALCEILGLPHLASDPRFDTLRKRAAHFEEIMPQIKAALMTKTALEWEALMIGRVPGIAIRDVGEMFVHPQVLAEDLVVEHDHPAVGKYKAVTTAVGYSASPAKTTRAPMLGEHTDEVLREFAFDEAAILALREAQAVL